MKNLRGVLIFFRYRSRRSHPTVGHIMHCVLYRATWRQHYIEYWFFGCVWSPFIIRRPPTRPSEAQYCFLRRPPITQTHTHTHTHMYIYIFIYMRSGADSMPISSDDVLCAQTRMFLLLRCRHDDIILTSSLRHCAMRLSARNIWLVQAHYSSRGLWSSHTAWTRRRVQ